MHARVLEHWGISVGGPAAILARARRKDESGRLVEAESWRRRATHAEAGVEATPDGTGQA